LAHPRTRLAADIVDTAGGRKDRRLPAHAPGTAGVAIVRIGVLGLWHLGCVTAAALAKLGHQVLGLDFDAARVAALQLGRAPLFEPGLERLLQRGLAGGQLRFATAAPGMARDLDLLWVTYDTPLDERGHAGAEPVVGEIERVLPWLGNDLLII